MKLTIKNIRTIKNNQGFTLLEVLVAVTILSLVGLMAWRGMDAMIRGNEVIDQRRNSDSAYLQLIKQFDKDCSDLPSAAQVGFSPYTLTSSEILLLKKSKLNGQTSWSLIAYKVSKEGLERQIILNKAELGELKDILTIPNKSLSVNLVNSETTMKVGDITNQTLLFLPESLKGRGNEFRGIQAQWFVKNIKDPITRSCLIGQGV